MLVFKLRVMGCLSVKCYFFVSDVMKWILIAERFKTDSFIKFMNEVQHTPIDYRDPEGSVEIWHEYDKWSTTIMKRIGMIK